MLWGEGLEEASAQDDFYRYGRIILVHTPIYRILRTKSAYQIP